MRWLPLLLAGLSCATAACSEDESLSPIGGSGGDGGHGGSAPGMGGSGGVAATTTNVRHLVVLIQENHTFDNHFGRYCTAPVGSNPTCNDGPACCEAGPEKDPGSSAAPVTLDDAAHGAYDPDHTQRCELEEMHGGAMDRFINASCGDPRNFAYSAPALVQPYWDYAARYALADRYFQPIAGASSSNDMYFARAGFVFTDNAYEPKGAVGAACEASFKGEFTDPTIGDLLKQAGVSWTFYAEGYRAMKELGGACPQAAPPGCPAAATTYPCVFDPGDIPFEYYPSLRDDPAHLRDFEELAKDLASRALPAVSFVKAIGYRTEHPGAGTRLSDGVAFAKKLIDDILSSSYGDDTLVLLTYDEGGGYFDHVHPPPDGPDGKPYGTRLPLLAIGRFAKKNWVSHVVMEHSSVVRFIEHNWLGGKTGQLGQRDAVVKGLGSLLDAAEVGAELPD